MSPLPPLGFKQFVAASTNSYESIASTTLSSSQATITFSSIPSTYKHLQVRAMMFGSTNGVDAPYLRFNGDTGSNYSFHTLLGESAAARAQNATSTSSINIGGFWFGLIGVNPNVSVIDILDYADTAKYKTTKTFTGQNDGATYGSIGLGSGSWRNTSAINSITILNSGSTNFTQYSSFALYGIKG